MAFSWTGSSTFTCDNRTLLIKFKSYFGGQGQEPTPQTVSHDSKSPIQWRVHAELDAHKLYIDPIDETINKNFKYSLYVSTGTSGQIYGARIYDGTKVECGLPETQFNLIEIQIVYPYEALIFCTCSAQKLINQKLMMEAKSLLPKMITKTRSRKKFSDIKFIVEDKVIVAHKMVLADRSEVFDKMFTWNRDESPSNAESIPISDVSYDAFDCFIDIIYYGTTSTDLEVCLEMIRLAEMYDIQDIKAAHEASVIAAINMENVITVMIHAYLNNADRIKEAALEFCGKNPVYKMNNRELGKYPDLLNEVFKQISLTKNL